MAAARGTTGSLSCAGIAPTAGVLVSAARVATTSAKAQSANPSAIRDSFDGDFIVQLNTCRADQVRWLRIVLEAVGERLDLHQGFHWESKLSLLWLPVSEGLS